jgi:hypothetical protein
MCELVAKLNLPITAADTFNKAFKIMFPRFKNSTRYTLFLPRWPPAGDII